MDEYSGNNTHIWSLAMEYQRMVSKLLLAVGISCIFVRFLVNSFFLKIFMHNKTPNSQNRSKTIQVILSISCTFFQFLCKLYQREDIFNLIIKQ